MLFDPAAVVRHRLLAGKSRAELAATAGLSGEAVRLIETGAVVPRPQTVKALADALGADVADLYAEVTA